MNVALFGATGMVGAGALIECLEDPRVASVLVIGRQSVGRTHPKLREVLLADFFDYGPVATELATIDACFFCLGVSALGLDEASYARLTYDLTLAAAGAMLQANPAMVFCYVSGLGTDSTERGRVMWARVKGRTENALLALPFRAAHMFRPGFIQPVKGVRSKTGWYQAVYSLLGPAYPLIRRLFPRVVTTTADLGRAFIAVAAGAPASRIIDPPEINRLGLR